MYSLPEGFGEAELDPGTSLLITGPPMTGKRRLGLDVLVNGITEGDGAIVVTTNEDAVCVLDDVHPTAGEVISTGRTWTSSIASRASRVSVNCRTSGSPTFPRPMT